MKTEAAKKTNKRSTVSPKQDGGAGDGSSTLYGPKGAGIPNFKGLSSLSSPYSNRAVEQIPSALNNRHNRPSNGNDRSGGKYVTAFRQLTG